MLAYSALGLTAILHRTKIISSPPIFGELEIIENKTIIIKKLMANGQ
jgi:hypothetical protein